MRYLIAVILLLSVAACATDPMACVHNPETPACKALPNDFGEGGNSDSGSDAAY